MDFTHLVNYETYEPPAPYYALNNTSFDNHFNLGYSTVFFAGHGSCSAYSDKYYASIYSDSDASSCTNTNMPSLVYAAACTTSPYDSDGPDDNIGESLINQKEAGAIGYIGALRTSWYFTDDENLEELNRGNAKLFWQEFFQNQKFQPGKALYDSKVAYITSDYYDDGPGSLEYDYERKQILTYCLLGDPEVDIYTDIPHNASNPFNDKIYEGQLLSFVVRDNTSKIIPYSRVHLQTSDGKYRTVYGNSEGKVSFRLPAQANENYNVTITGHNLLPTYYNFSTLADENKPTFSDDDYNPSEPTISDNIKFEIEVSDSQSGIEGVFILESNENDFDEYECYKMFHSVQDEEDVYTYTINKLEPGDHYFVILARDWANNKRILEDSVIKISIPAPFINFVLIGASIIILSVAGLSVFIFIKNRKSYFHHLERLTQK
jgi:hypothetical protein